MDSDTIFPIEFGKSPEDFLKKYQSIIYKIIYEQTKDDTRLETEDLFNDFFIFIAEDNYRRIRSFQGKSQPITYLAKILRNFLCDQYRKKGAKVHIKSLSETPEDSGANIPHKTVFQQDVLANNLINKALQETFLKLSNREKLIFDLFIDKEMTAKEIADLLGIKVKAVYKNNEKIKKILKRKLKNKGVGEI